MTTNLINTVSSASETVNVVAAKTAVESDVGFTFLKYNHVELSLDRIRVIFTELANDLNALTPGHGPEERLRVVDWAENYVRNHRSQFLSASDEEKDETKRIHSAATQLYNTICYLIEGYPGIVVKRGRHGGAYRVA